MQNRSYSIDAPPTFESQKGDRSLKELSVFTIDFDGNITDLSSPPCFYRTTKQRDVRQRCTLTFCANIQHSFALECVVFQPEKQWAKLALTWGAEAER